ncbi:hypothetical protein BCV72DRAFT_20393 [Rhizopus microsporus var. microsporus]|uniref:Fe2OG dioxygenase domain-containing protein n=1 Tax=Rhizopus microsporus var. microsporus TaxID=86635 RepID=A0A1X0QWH0_RHIZD|nr:hypothetical protein BCV72DRAFT_20393 [Rhizopus microsporus var. microsporus]
MVKSKKEENNIRSSPFPRLSTKNYLELEELEPEQIYVIPNFLNAKECESVITYFTKHLPPKENTSTRPKKGEAFRNNDRQAMEDAQVATELWKLLEPIVQEPLRVNKRPIGLNSNIRIYRYRKGHSFGPHYDDSVQDKHTGLWTEWTLLVYLNQDMLGGETVFFPDRKTDPPIVVKPQRGMALLHRHGTHCLLHEAKQVLQGEKWVLRSDVVVG